MSGDKYTEVMLDIETLGKGPNAAIISIGAVKFNLEEELVIAGIDESRLFYRVIELEEIRGDIDGSTVKFWLSQNDSARAPFTSKEIHRVHPVDALHSFSVFLASHSHLTGRRAETPCHYNIWGNGATFDNVILSSAYHETDMTKPWAYNQDRDMRTIKYLAQKMVPDIDFYNIPRVGTYHNALDDALTQVLVVQRCWRALSGKLYEHERKREEQERG